jgi:site-specific DNA-methyltransferase (adenine-specific)
MRQSIFIIEEIMELNSVHHGDCLEIMKQIPDHSVDMVLADLPYGMTALKWDVKIPMPLLWNEYKRVCKPNAVMAFTASQPFTTMLIASNIKQYKYCWYWIKNQGTNFFHAKRMPIRKVEEIVIFGGKTYNPQITDGHVPTTPSKGKSHGKVYRGKNTRDEKGGKTTRYPNNVLHFDCVDNYSRFHSSEKPVALFEYLIKTYTHEGDTVLDNVAGTGTTGIACRNTNRNFILIEKDSAFVDIIRKRLITTF